MTSAQCSKMTADRRKRIRFCMMLAHCHCLVFFTAAFLAAAAEVEFTMTDAKDDFLDYDDD